MDGRHQEAGANQAYKGEETPKNNIIFLKEGAGNRLGQILKIKGSFNTKEIANGGDNPLTLTM